MVELTEKAYGFQKDGADLIVDVKSMYLMWDMGIGKTLTCILAMRKLGMPVFVLAPLNAALITWPNELDRWAPDISYVVLHGPQKDYYAARAHEYDVVIMNFEGMYWWYDKAIRKQIRLQKYFVIWDESSMLKDSTTKRWAIMDEAMPIWSPYRVCLSGTPMPTHLKDLWAQYYLMDKGKRLLPSFYQFKSRYFIETGPPRYHTSIRVGAEDHIYKKIADITDRLDGDDYLELPEVIHNDIFLELPTKRRKMYDELEKEFMLEFEIGDVIAGSSAVLDSKLRQFLQGGLYITKDDPDCRQRQVQYLHEEKSRLLRSVVETSNGQPILAPVQFRFEYKIICDLFKKEIPIINGATPAKLTRELIERWNRKELPLLLCHPRSVAYSLNLQFGGHTIFWHALPWEMDLYKQLIRRLRRQGQESKHVIVHRAIFKDTIDEKIASVLARKDVNQERLFQAMTRR